MTFIQAPLKQVNKRIYLTGYKTELEKRSKYTTEYTFITGSL